MFYLLFRVFKLGLTLGMVTALVGCAATTSPQPTPMPKPAEQIATPVVEQAGPASYNDPFAYCATVGTIDTPDGRYKGDKLPTSIIQGMIQQGLVSADAPPEFQKNAVWRCMNNRVWVCHFGANLPCQEKADMSKSPTTEMTDFCKANPTTDNIPAAVTGRATVYEWGCQAGKAEVVKQVFKSDAQGYLADFWYELAPK